MTTISPDIFKAYDVRGLYGQDIDGDAAEQIGRAFARVIGELEGKPASALRLGLGRDMRLTAPELSARYRDGMMSEGADVLDAGQVGTEMLYYLVGSRELDGGLMCTASHNPKPYTGAKLVKRGAIALSGDSGIKEIRELVASGLGEAPGGGSVTEVELYDEFQGAALKQADLGIAWDGDADRCFFIDEQGAFVDGDFLTALLAESLLAKRPGATILYDVRASRAVADIVQRAGGTALMNRVGHAFFKTRMREEGGIFGGEVSGHYYFRDFYCADSGTIPALLILELLSARGASMSELLEPYRSHYFISGEINSEVSDPAGKIEELAARYADAHQHRLDGISVDYDDWHFNLRASNTEPLLRLCLESLRSPEDMERRRDEVLAAIRS
jgi:phosphomannomutase